MSPLFPELGRRSRRPELMDDADLEPERHVRALQALARINAVSGTAGRIWAGLKRLHPEPVQPGAGGERSLRLLDVACGGGDVVLRLAQRARREGLEVELEGCDASRVAVEHATDQARERRLQARFFRRDVISSGLPGGYDVVCSTLFLHHLSEADVVSLLGEMVRTARLLVVVEDLRRTRAGYALAWLGTRLLTRSEVARTDGPRSVESAFTLTEARRLTSRAGMERAEVVPCWPQRFLLSWGPS